MSGAVSGLGSSEITSQIDTYEQRLQAPITQLDDQISTDKAEISAWGTIQGSISTLSTSLSGIENLSSINTRTATSGTAGILSATAAASAQLGTYNVSVSSLAAAQEIYSTTSATGGASASAKLGSAKAGSLKFTFGSGKTETVSVGSGSMTLSGIASAINAMAGGVKAGVVSTAKGAELTLQSSATGSSQAFTVKGSTTELSKFDYSGANTSSMALAQSASDSTMTINGVPLTSTSNKISSAMTGVSLTLTGTGDSTLTIGSSTTSISSAVGKVASDLNSAIATIGKETYWAGSSTTTTSSASSSSSSAKKTGALAGNYNAEAVSNQLLSAVSDAAASGMTSNTIGLTVSSKGAVALNSTTFASAYAKNPTAVQNLLKQVYTSLGTATKQALGSSTSTSTSGTTTSSTGNTVGEGTIGAQTNSLQSTITSINSEISQMEKTDTTELDNLASAYSTSESAATNASITSMYLDVFTSTATTSSSS